MPVSFWEVTSSMAPVATAASMALPPCRRMSSPACAASGSLVATMPWRATTSERPWLSQPCARDPGTALMSAAGCGFSADGCPKGFWDWAASATQAPAAQARASGEGGDAREAWRTSETAYLGYFATALGVGRCADIRRRCLPRAHAVPSIVAEPGAIAPGIASGRS